jgi:transcription factor C subunit 6
MVAVWDISVDSQAAPFDIKTRGKILMAYPLHRTYILSLAAAYPSRPHLLASSSIDGLVQLTNLQSPTSSVRGPRLAIGNAALSWNDHIQAFFTYDNTYSVRMHPLRRFFNTTTVMLTQSAILSLSSSVCHPFILASGAGGEVEVSNPLRKFFDQHHRKLPAYQQRWFLHQWRKIDPTEPVMEHLKIPEGSPPTTGLSRILESFRLAPVTSRHINPGPSKNKGKEKAKPKSRPNSSSAHGASSPQAASTLLTATAEPKERPKQPNYDAAPQTIYEMKTAVTKVVWNSNLECGGWAAAAMGCGLIRVEDLCL